MIQNKFKRIACGYYHSLAKDKEGVMYSWGRNRYGQLGHGAAVLDEKEEDARAQNTYPSLVQGVLLRVKVDSIACGW